MKNKKEFWLPILILVAFSFAVSFFLPGVFDYDPHLHFREAEQYRTNGLFDSSYTFLEHSAFRDHPSDLWYGFRILIIPFTFIEDPLVAIPLMGAVLLSIFLVGLFLIMRSSGYRKPVFFIFFYLFSWMGIVGRMTTPRPFVLSTFLILLLYFSLVKRWKYWYLFLISFLLCWIHLALIWTIPLVVGTVFVADIIYKRPTYFSGWLAIISGSVVGIFARPHPIDGLQLLWIQVGEVMIAKAKGVALPFGAELMPLDPRLSAFVYLVPFLTVFILAIYVFLKQNKLFQRSTRMEISGNAFVAVVFIFVSFFMASRSADIGFMFATLFIAGLYTHYRPIPYWLRSTFVCITIIMFTLNVTVFVIFRSVRFVNINDIRSTSLWLKDNANEGDLIVTSGQWDSQKIYFWNQKMHFLNFSDPIFMHVYDRGSNDRLIDYIWQGNDTKIDYDKKNIEGLYKSLEYFDTEYLVVDGVFYPKLVMALEHEDGFQLVYQDRYIFLYKILSINEK